MVCTVYRRTVQVIGERRQATALRGGQFRHVHRPDASTDQSVATQQPRARLRTPLLPTSSLNQWRIQKIVLGYLILPYLQTRGGCAPSGVAGAEPPLGGIWGGQSPQQLES